MGDTENIGTKVFLYINISIYALIRKYISIKFNKLELNKMYHAETIDFVYLYIVF